MPVHSPVVSITGFQGLNNVLKPENTPDNYLKEVNNLNIDKKGRLSSREGYSIIDTGSYTTIWSNLDNTSCYVVKGGHLYKLLDNYTLKLLKENVGETPLSFEEVNGTIYFTSTYINGIIENDVVRTWGLSIPQVFLSPTETTGSLLEGTYQVSYTYLDITGLESGSNYASQVTVSDSSGISVDIPLSSDPRVVSSRVYCSTQNGSELFYAGETLPGSTYIIADTSTFSNPINMFNLDSAPLGSSVNYYKGRLFITDGKYLWYSEPNQYEHFNLGSNYLELPGDIVEVIPVETGLWVGTESIYYISGDSPETFRLTLKDKATIVTNTATRIPGAYLQIDNTPLGYNWLVTTDIGIYVLYNKGVLLNLTSENVSLIQGNKGTAIFLQENGLNQYLSILEKKEDPNNSVMGDLVTTTVIRNGITLQE